MENFFTSWKSSLTGIAGGIAGVLVLTSVIPVGTGVAALAIVQVLIGALVKEK
jgi:hypothetical protein